MEIVDKRKVSFENLHNKENSKCLICNNEAEIQNILINRNTNEKTKCYWDICEKCKKSKNCFTCAYSKIWYLRYKGRCDLSFEYLIVSTFFFDKEEKEVSEEEKEEFQVLLKKCEIEVKDRSITISEFLKIIDDNENISEDNKELFWAILVFFARS